MPAKVNVGAVRISSRDVPFSQLVLFAFCNAVSGITFYWNYGLVQGYREFLLVISLAALSATCLGLCLTELTSALPLTDGIYGIARSVINPFVGFMVGFNEIVSQLVFLAHLAYLFGLSMTMLISESDEYTQGNAYRSHSSISQYEPLFWLLFLFIVVAPAIHNQHCLLWRTTTVYGSIALVLLLVYILGSATYVRSGRYPFWNEQTPGLIKFFPAGIDGFFGIMPFALWVFRGVDALPLAASITDKPRRSIPIAIVIVNLLLVVAIFLVSFSGCAQMPGVEDMSSRTLPLVNGFARVFRITNQLAVIFILPFLVASAQARMYAVAQTMRCMAAARLLPEYLEQLDHIMMLKLTSFVFVRRSTSAVSSYSGESNSSYGYGQRISRSRSALKSLLRPSKWLRSNKKPAKIVPICDMTRQDSSQQRYLISTSMDARDVPSGTVNSPNSVSAPADSEDTPARRPSLQFLSSSNRKEDENSGDEAPVVPIDYEVDADVNIKPLSEQAIAELNEKAVQNNSNSAISATTAPADSGVIGALGGSNSVSNHTFKQGSSANLEAATQDKQSVGGSETLYQREDSKSDDAALSGTSPLFQQRDKNIPGMLLRRQSSTDLTLSELPRTGMLTAALIVFLGLLVLFFGGRYTDWNTLVVLNTAVSAMLLSSLLVQFSILICFIVFRLQFHYYVARRKFYNAWGLASTAMSGAVMVAAVVGIVAFPNVSLQGVRPRGIHGIYALTGFLIVNAVAVAAYWLLLRDRQTYSAVEETVRAYRGKDKKKSMYARSNTAPNSVSFPMISNRAESASAVAGRLAAARMKSNDTGECVTDDDPFKNEFSEVTDKGVASSFKGLFSTSSRSIKKQNSPLKNSTEAEDQSSGKLSRSSSADNRNRLLPPANWDQPSSNQNNTSSSKTEGRVHTVNSRSGGSDGGNGTAATSAAVSALNTESVDEHEDQEWEELMRLYELQPMQNRLANLTPAQQREIMLLSRAMVEDDTILSPIREGDYEDRSEMSFGSRMTGRRIYRDQSVSMLSDDVSILS